MWGENDPPQSFKMEMGNQLASGLMNSEATKQEELYKTIKDNEEALAPFINEDFYPVFVATYLNIKDKEGVNRWLKKQKPFRKLATSKSNLPQEVRDFLSLKKGEGFMSLKKYKEGEEVLKEVKTSRYLEPALLLRISSMQAMKQYSQAYKAGNALLQRLSSKESKVRVLASLVPVINEGKVWEKAEPLLAEARKQKAEGKALAPFLFLVGKVQSEKKNCKRSVAAFTEAIAIETENPMINEAKFRLAKCYLKEKKKELAKKQWQEVVDSKDPFWSPMAKSELNLMEAP